MWKWNRWFYSDSDSRESPIPKFLGGNSCENRIGIESVIHNEKQRAKRFYRWKRLLLSSLLIKSAGQLAKRVARTKRTDFSLCDSIPIPIFWKHFRIMVITFYKHLDCFWILLTNFDGYKKWLMLFWNVFQKMESE